MRLNIRNPETERQVLELASVTGESVTHAITVAVRERLARLRHADPTQARVARLREIAADAANRWVEPHRTASHADLLYDEHGLPT